MTIGNWQSRSRLAAVRYWRISAQSVAAALWLVASAVVVPTAANAQDQAGFGRFVESLWPEAKAFGISKTTFDKAFAGVEADFSIPDLVLPGKRDDKGQAEFTRTPAQYVNAAYLARLSQQGKTLLVKHRDALDKIERELGVQRQFVLAIWGRETAFGAHKSPHYAVQVLATQAYAGRRKDMFRNELMHALKMLEDGVRTRDNMRSSWAGAMGLTQFMPSEYYALAYDLDGDGDKDIWNSVPDALASAANQLRFRGWVRDQTWAYEVRLPEQLSCRAEGPPSARTVRDWAKLGVVRTSGGKFPPDVLDARAFILSAGGAHGPAFLALENFMVIKRYNMSDLYAMFVGNLGDRIAGGGGFDTPWGEVRQLSSSGIEAIQQQLQTRGYDVAKIDGKAGMNTRALVGAYQHANGLKVDCWPSDAVLTHMRRSAARERPRPAPAKSAVDTH